MINNDHLSFNVDDFVDSLLNLQKTSHAEPKLPLREALASGKFVRADLGVFRKSDDHSVWELKTDDAGQQFIVRTEQYDTPTQASWTASANRTGDSVTLAYKGYPVRRFAKAEFNYEDANDFAQFLVKKASSEQKFATGVAKTLPFQERVALQKKFAIFREG